MLSTSCGSGNREMESLKTGGVPVAGENAAAKDTQFAAVFHTTVCDKFVTNVDFDKSAIRSRACCFALIKPS